MKTRCLFLVLIALAFWGCDGTKSNLNAAWRKAEKIDYNEPYAYNEALINEIRADFQRVQKSNMHDWMNGYIQECQLLTGLYIRHLIEKDEMLQEIQVVYDRFLEKNSLNAQNTFSYAILQYLRGNRDESKKLLEPMYIRDYKYHFTRETLVDSDIKNFLCGALLGEIDVADFKGTVYDELGFVNGVEMCLIECLQVTNY